MRICPPPERYPRSSAAAARTSGRYFPSGAPFLQVAARELGVEAKYSSGNRSCSDARLVARRRPPAGEAQPRWLTVIAAGQVLIKDLPANCLNQQ
ncbi:hypothetical protein ACNKHL_23665 [Shigella flexneri]